MLDLALLKSANAILTWLYGKMLVALLVERLYREADFFHPGGTQYNTPNHKSVGHKKNGVRSPWREFEFWFMAVQHAIAPMGSIEKALKNWLRIRERLMENYRKRQLQIDYIMPLI